MFDILRVCCKSEYVVPQFTPLFYGTGIDVSADSGKKLRNDDQVSLTMLVQNL